MHLREIKPFNVHSCWPGWVTGQLTRASDRWGYVGSLRSLAKDTSGQPLPLNWPGPLFVYRDFKENTKSIFRFKCFSWRSEKICFVSDSFTLHAFDHWVYWIVLTSQNNALSMSSIYNEKTLKDPKHKPWLIKKNQSHLLLNNVKFIHVNIQYKQNKLITRTINKSTVVIWYIFRFQLLLFNQILLQKTVGLCSATMEGVSFLLQVCWVLEPRFIVVSYNRSPYLVTSYVTNGIKM